jgi:hypothetical protein
MISDRLQSEWYQYVGSNLTTTREFCEHLTKKRYVHKSEIPELLKGNIDGHQCKIYSATGLPQGMIEGTNEENFIVYRGGYNCGHELIPVSEATVPVSIRQKIQYPQKEGIVKQVEYKETLLYFDPTGIKTFSDLAISMAKKAAPKIRKAGFKNYLDNNEHKVYKSKNGNIYAMRGSKYNDTEFHIAEKLVKANYHILFPNQGDLGKGRKNDVYIYNTETYVQTKVELKSLFGDTAESVKSNLISGSGQASVVAYDIQSGIKKNWLIRGLRDGWSKDTKKVMLNWKGRWYEINKELLFDQQIYRVLR